MARSAADGDRRRAAQPVASDGLAGEGQRTAPSQENLKDRARRREIEGPRKAPEGERWCWAPGGGGWC
eukprot:4742217-Pleurochrysis_carterae.AAC.1